MLPGWIQPPRPPPDKNYRLATALTTGHELHAMLRIRQVIYGVVSEDVGRTAKR